jgi:hypothetical protein
MVARRRPKSVSIPVNHADAFFFGNWRAGSSMVAHTDHYTDGTDNCSRQRPTSATGWEDQRPPAGERHGPNGRTESYVINTFAVPTDGSKTIESVELRKSGMMAPIVFAITVGRLSALPLVEGVLATRNLDIVRMVGDTDALDLASNTDADYTIAAPRCNGGRTPTTWPRTAIRWRY